MKNLSRTLFCSMLMVPGIAQAEIKFGGEVVVGYGDTDGTDGAYGILSATASDSYKLDSGIGITWTVRGRVRSDQSDLSDVDNEAVDASLEFDFGKGGKLGFTTFNDIGQYPWADGELYNRGSVGVHPVIKKRFDTVADTQFTGPNFPDTHNRVDPDLLVTYSNKLGPVILDVVANPLQKWDGYDKDDLNGAIPTIEGKLTLPTKHGIYSIAYNDLDDAELQIVYPIRKIGVTVIARRSINEGDFGDYRNNLAVIYRAKNMGVFKGAMLAHGRDEANKRTMLNLNFGGDQWKLKVAGDSDGDYAAEASYAFNDKTSIQFGYDSGHEVFEGFDDEAFPAPVFAPTRGSAFEIALVHKF